MKAARRRVAATKRDFIGRGGIKRDLLWRFFLIDSVVSHESERGLI
jgi:hypothetical protein